MRLAAAQLSGSAPQTLVAFAEANRLSPSFLSRVERGERTTSSVAWLQRVAADLGITTYDIATDA